MFIHFPSYSYSGSSIEEHKCKWCLKVFERLKGTNDEFCCKKCSKRYKQAQRLQKVGKK